LSGTIFFGVFSFRLKCPGQKQSVKRKTARGFGAVNFISDAGGDIY